MFVFQISILPFRKTIYATQVQNSFQRKMLRNLTLNVAFSFFSLALGVDQTPWQEKKKCFGVASSVCKCMYLTSSKYTHKYFPKLVTVITILLPFLSYYSTMFPRQTDSCISWPNIWQSCSQANGITLEKLTHIKSTFPGITGVLEHLAHRLFHPVTISRIVT